MPSLDADAIVAEVDALYAGGLAPRTTVPLVRDGTTLFLVNPLYLECTACGMRVPQSRSRPADAARGTWLRDHLRCPRD